MCVCQFCVELCSEQDEAATTLPDLMTRKVSPETYLPLRLGCEGRVGTQHVGRLAKAFLDVRSRHGQEADRGLGSSACSQESALSKSASGCERTA